MVVVDDNSNIKWKKIKLLNATTFQGRIQDFKLGGVAHLKKIRQKIIFFPIAEVGAKFFGVFRVKNYI